MKHLARNSRWGWIGPWGGCAVVLSSALMSPGSQAAVSGQTVLGTADVKVTVRDAQKRVVFDDTLDGPWLFLQLPQGRYDVQARWADETLQQITTVHPGDHHQAFFYFNVPDRVSPESRRPFLSNPYGDSNQ